VISNYNVSIVNSAGKYGLYLSSTTSALSITNSTISNGLYIGSTAIVPTVTGNAFTNLDNSPIHVGANIVAQIIANNTLTGFSSAGRVEVIGEQVSQNTTWNQLVAPYVVVSGTVSVYNTTTSPPTLTIAPGTVVKFASGAGLQIGNGPSQGALVAKGTGSNRITFTRNAASGNWGNITFNDGTVDATTTIENADIQYSSDVYIYSSSPSIKNSTIKDINGSYGIMLNSANPVLENITITTNSTYGMYLSSSSPVISGGSLTNTNSTGQGVYGGGSPVISNYNVSIVNSAGKYGLYLSSTTSTLSVTNSTISNGLYIGSTAIAPTITGNTFTNLDNSPLHAGANIIARVLDSNTFNGLTPVGRIEVVGEQVTQNLLWKKWIAPYLVLGTIYVYKDTSTTSTLTIEPGTIVKFSTNTGLQIGSGSYRGVLVADAPPANPIIFTSSQATPSPGNWSGITFSGDAAASSTLNNVIIEYGGAGGSYSSANLTLFSSSPTIRNTTIRNSAGSGVYMSSAANLPRVFDSIIHSNKWGIYSVNSNPCIANSNIYGNSTAGVWNATTTIDVDARNNWWGASSGPYHASNPSGTGNSVSDKILFSPWIGQTPASGLTFGNVRIAPTAFNPEGDYLTFAATLSASANWTITITDSANAVVRTFTGTGSDINLKWYGEDSQSAKVADGSYTYKIEAVNPATSETASPLQGIIKVLRQLPIAILDTPTDNQILSGGTAVNITGTAADSVDFKQYTLEYGTGDNPVSWTVLKSLSSQVQNALIYTWDLSSATGGVYTIRLTVTDNAGNTTAKTARIRLLWIRNAAVSESYISPNGDNIKDAAVISATASYPVNWTVTISNSAGTPVRAFTGTGDALTQTWDGKNTIGEVVTDGVYTYLISARDPATSVPAAPKSGTVTVDNTFPAAAITAPASGATLRNTVPVVGTASDSNLDNYRVEYGPSSGPWTLLSTADLQVTIGALSTWVTNDQGNTVPTQNGSYTLRLTVTDKAGNTSTATIPVVLDNLFLSNISASSHNLDTNTGQADTISFTVSDPATVNLKIVPEKLGSSGAPVYQASLNCTAAGPYSFAWDGKDGTGKVVPDEAYLYILEASDGTRTDNYAPPATAGIGSVTCTQAAGYYPYRNIPLAINYSVSQPERVDINIHWGSRNFKIMDGVPHLSGSYTFNWDGRDPTDNKVLDGGGVAYCSAPSNLSENHIITTGNTPKVTYVRTDPYQAHLSFGQFTRVQYGISKQSNVTVKLISPTGASAVLVDDLSQAPGDYELDWTAADISDATGKGFVMSGEGDYMVWVQATNPVTGASSVAKGSLRVGN
jgi:flagellar hook assembly protein FlgD